MIEHGVNTKAHPLKTASSFYDVALVGGGLMGLSLAAILGEAGLRVVCVERHAPEHTLADTFDGRTTALSLGTRHILEKAGLWDKLAPLGCPIEQIRVVDGDSSLYLHFDHKDIGDMPFGWIVENRLMRGILYDRLKSVRTPVELLIDEATAFEPHQGGMSITLKSGTIIHTQLLVGADGQFSSVREWAGIGTKEWDYKQSAIVCCVDHELDHENIAIEHFLPAGPFAVLPMMNEAGERTRSSVVWSLHGEDAQSIVQLDDAAFHTRLQSLFGDQLGTVSVVGKRFTYPLGLKHAETYTAPRTALIGEAAHRIHPIAGQGLNLGMRDVGVLADLLIESKLLGLDCGRASMLQIYERKRRLDNKTMAVATDGLNKLFSNENGPVKRARQIGLGLVEITPPLKRFFMRQAMGLTSTALPPAPKVLRGKRA